MSKKLASFALLPIALVVLSCSGSTDKKDTGGVRLVFGAFDGLPVIVSASTLRSTGVASIGTLTIQSIALNPTGDTSQLMNVELQGLEFTYTRGDTGTRLPPPLVEYVFGQIPVGGSTTINNSPFMRVDQANTQPLSDLVTFGRDSETGTSVVRLRVAIRAFGKTMSGTRVDSEPGYFTIDVVP
jgi:hypothetical protein